MPSSTATLRRFEAGGVLTINDGTTAYDIVAVEPGTLEWQEGFYKPLEYTDRGAIQTPYEGDEQPSRIKVRVKYTGSHAAADVRKHVVSRDTSTGKMKMYTVTIKNPDYKGAITGEQLQWANCWLSSPARVSAGQDFDHVEVEFMSKAVSPSTSTY